MYMYVCVYVCMYVLIIGDAFCNDKHGLIRRHDQETEDLRAQLWCVSMLCVYVCMYVCVDYW